MSDAPKKIRAVFVINDFIIGGVQRLYLELFTHLDQDAYDLHLVTLMDLPGRVDMYGAIPANVTVHRLAFTSLRDFRAWGMLRKLLASLQPDIVLTSLFFSNTVVRGAGLFATYPIISIEQNTNTWKTFPQIVADKLLSYRSAVIIAASKTVEDFASKQAGIPRSLFRIVHNSIDMQKLRAGQEALTDRTPLLKEFGFTPENRIVINVARLTEQKNHPMLIEAFARFAKEYPAYRLLVLGEGPKRTELEALIAKHDAIGLIVLAGARQDVVSYYALAEFFVSTSFIEGFGIAHAEALACGMPLLSTKTAGPDEMIEEGKNGRFVDCTVESIYDGLVRMATEGVSDTKDELRASVARFDSPVIAHKYDDLIREVLKRPRP